MSEYLDIVDQYGNPTGSIIERNEAHLHGIRHRTSHVWIMRHQNHKIQLMLQKRSINKDLYPGCFDISSAGHIPAGDDFIISAVRECREELGIDIKGNELIEAGIRNIDQYPINHGIQYHDVQVSKVFYIFLEDLAINDVVVQEEEVESVIWMDFDECYTCVMNNTIRHCIAMEELEILRRSLYDQNRND